jgi:hypothetical protein
MRLAPCRRSVSIASLTVGLAALVALLAGCGKMPDTRDRLGIYVNYKVEQDFPAGFPFVRSKNEPKVEGAIRKMEAKRDFDGVEFRGERIEVVKRAESKVAGQVMAEVLARRVVSPEPHIDLHIRSAVLFEVFFTFFEGGEVRDGATGEVIKPRYQFDAGTYHLKAYKALDADTLKTAKSAATEQSTGPKGPRRAAPLRTGATEAVPQATSPDAAPDAPPANATGAKPTATP